MTKAPGTTPFTRPKGRSVIHRQQRPHFTPALAAASGCFPGPFLPADGSETGLRPIHAEA